MPLCYTRRRWREVNICRDSGLLDHPGAKDPVGSPAEAHGRPPRWPRTDELRGLVYGASFHF